MSDERIDSLRFGNLCLETEGCGLYWILIVRGDQRGFVWQLADGGTEWFLARLPGFGFWRVARENTGD